MTKKQFAYIMTTKEELAKMRELADYTCNGHVTSAYANMKQIKAILDRLQDDFGDVDPYWKRNNAEKAEQATA